MINDHIATPSAIFDEFFTLRRPSRHPCRYVNNYFPDPLLSDTEERNTMEGAQPFHCAYYIYRSYRKTLKKKIEK